MDVDWAFTPDVVTINVAELLPEATVTEDGTLEMELLLERETAVPPLPAGPLKVTVPVEEFPPTTEVGARLTETRVAGVIVNVAV